MRSRALLLLVLVLAGCADDPDELLRYSGTVSNADRTAPLPGQTVQLLRSNDIHCFGLQPYTQRVTDADGGWSAQLYRGELELPFTDGRYGRCVEIAATFPSGARTNFYFTRLFSVARLPPLFEWTANVELFDGGLRWTPIETPERSAELDLERAGAFSAAVTHEATVTAQGVTVVNTSDVVVEFPDLQSPAPNLPTVTRLPIELPPWMFEDFDATLSVVAKEVRPIDSSSSTLASSDHDAVVVRHEPAVSPEVKGALVPVSRGASCPPLADPCVLTDGLLKATIFDPMDGGLSPLAGGFEVVLPRPAVVRRIVLRGGFCCDTLQLVELRDAADALVSLATPEPEVVDGTRFTLPDHPGEDPPMPDGPVGPLAPLLSWTLPATTPAATRVKLVFQSGPYVASEVSLFEEP